ncbi:MAG: hypothetical protein K0S75_1919 [Clostridia bacterium]|nr:hypothetical protein [Clostridia bacterium]
MKYCEWTCEKLGELPFGKVSDAGNSRYRSRISSINSVSE